MSTAEPPTFTTVLDAADALGEGPVWDEQTGALWWVDILGKRVHRLSADAAHDTFDLPCVVGAFALTQDGRLVLATETGFAFFEPTRGELEVIADCVPAGLRMNDGKCDAAGRFWAGTCPTGPGGPPGALFVLEPDGRVHRVLDGILVANGLGWTADNTVMYWTDSFTKHVDRMEYDLVSGSVGARVPFAHVPDALPDGLAVDEAGGVWVAAFRGGQLRHFAASGELVEAYDFPCENPTSCAFGGPELDTLFVTSARSRTGQSAEDCLEPPAGALFSIRPGVRGMPSYRFGAAHAG